MSRFVRHHNCKINARVRGEPGRGWVAGKDEPSGRLRGGVVALPFQGRSVWAATRALVRELKTGT